MEFIHRRFKDIFVENLDFRECLRRYDNKDFLVYADPPYVPSTWKSGTVFRNEMTFEDHEDLVKLLLDFEGKVILSGYVNDLYKILEDHGWKRYDVKAKMTCSPIRRNTDRIESFWLNPQCSTTKRGFLF